jgi:hypothetical protein
MRTKIFSIVLPYLISVLAGSCKKNISLPYTGQAGSLPQVFEAYWNKMNTNYVYWDMDTTDWDEVYRLYKPKFASLDINKQKDVDSAVGYFRQMTAGLIDGHYTITFHSPFVPGLYISPSLDRKLVSPGFRNPWSYTNIDTGYLDKGFLTGSYVTADNLTLNAVCGTIHQNILYFQCNRFALKEAYTASGSNSIRTVLNMLFDRLQNSSGALKGVIIDVRNNPGGKIEDLNFLAGRLVGTPLLFGYSRYKSGDGRLAYTPWIEADVVPPAANAAVTVPITVLTDSYSVSLAELFAMVIHTLPNGKVVGETTWGATGPLTDNAVYNDGQFDVGNFLSVYTSSAAFEYVDGRRYEGKGFPPDVAVPFDPTALSAGHDPCLEKAL